MLVGEFREVAYENMDPGYLLVCAERGPSARGTVRRRNRLQPSSGTGTAAWSRDTKRHRDRRDAARREVLA
jgi:hypothetical protein